MYILKRVLNSLKHLVTSGFQRLHSNLTRWTKPLNTSLVLGTVSDLFRSKSQLVAENALLRQQLIILRRQVKRPGCTKVDRKVLVLTRANAVCERFLGSVRRECLDHLFALHEKQVYRVLKAYVEYFNHMRPHQGIKQQAPESLGSPVPSEQSGGQVIALTILGGLHHDYRRTA